MPEENYRIFALGDSALTVEFGREISVDLNERALRLAEQLDKDSFPGFIESLPAYASTTVFYDSVEVRKSFPEASTASDIVKQIISARLLDLETTTPQTGRLVEIPVKFGGDRGPDLAFISGVSGLSESDVISLFISTSYRVYMLGFLPGFAYMGEVDERIAVPRKSTPRLSVRKGSVGIAGKQTGIYPLDSPGGWQIIGRTNVEMFTPDSPEICRFRPGDSVKFVRA
jgi:inhibitor of KinA